MANKKQQMMYPNYDFGGWVKENKEGIIGGAQLLAGGIMTATGVGAPLGMGLMAGGASALAGELMDGNSQAAIPQQMVGSQSNQLAAQPTFAMGGMIPGANAELEQGEVYRTPDGSIEEIKDSNKLSHNNGGVPGMYPGGTQVLGKLKDKQTGMTFKEIGQKIAAQKRKLAQLKEETKNKLTQNSVKAMSQKLDDKFTEVFNRQEASKPTPRATEKMEDGGPISGLNNQRTVMNTDYTLGQSPGLPSYQQMMADTGDAGLVGINDPSMFALNGGFTGLEADIGSVVNPLAQVAPVAYNVAQGLRKPEKERLPAQYNQALSALRNRRFNVNPILEANRNIQAIGDQNAKVLGGGATASNRLANTAARMRGDASARSQESNVNNQYAGDYAQGLFGAGQAQRGVDVANLQNEAATRNFLATSMSQGSELAQRNELMQNMGIRDQQELDVLKKWMPMLSKQFGDLNWV